LVDHLSVEAATEQPDLAEEMAPVGEDTPISQSTAKAQDATMRLLHGLPYRLPKEAVFEDYVVVWLHDANLEVQKVLKRGGLATPDELNGLMNLGQNIDELLQVMEQQAEATIGDTGPKAKLREYQDMAGQLQNHVKGLAQRLQESMATQAGGNGAQVGDPKDAAKVEAMLIQAQTKAQIADRASQQRTAQKQVQWEQGEKRKDEQTAAEIQRQGVRTRHELLAGRLKALAE